MILEKWLLMSRNVYNPAGGQRLFLVGGVNPTGQLGFNATTRVNDLTQLGSLSWSQISVGRSHTVAIRSDGLLFTWGSNFHGALGTGNDQRGNWRSSPVQIGTDSWSFVNARAFHTMAIRSDGLLFGWGDNSRGQLGDNTQFNDERVSNDWSVVNNGVFLKTNGTLWTAGSLFAKLGRPATAYGTVSPVQVGSDTNWAKVASGLSHAAAIKTDGSLYVWGINANGQLGDGTVINRSSPVQLGTSSWTMVNCGADHTMAITSDGKLFVWGRNQAGQLGDSTTINKSSPIQIATANTWSNVSAGVTHSAAIRNDGMLFTWGNNLFGQLGDNSIANTSSPVQIGTSSWTVVSASGFNTHAIRLGGGLFGWGRNDSGVFLVGDGTTIARSSPVQIAASNTFTSVFGALSGTFNAVFAIETNTTLYRWGNRNNFRNIGTGADYSVPTIVDAGNLGTTPATGWTVIDNLGTQGINSGTIYHWSFDLAADKYEDFFFATSTPSNGRVLTPFGRAARRYSPVQIGSSSWSMVAASDSHTVAIRSDNTLWGWGDGYLNGNGGVVTTTPINRSSPVLVGTDIASLNTKSWTAVSASVSHNLAISNQNELYAWGRNDAGYVGKAYHTVEISGPYAYIDSQGYLFRTGDNIWGNYGNNTSEPVVARLHIQIGNKTWRKISLNYAGQQAQAIDTEYRWWTVGRGSGFSTGTLGDNTNVNGRSSFVQIGTDKDTPAGSFTLIGHRAAIHVSGNLYMFGMNTDGEVGDNSTIARSSPVQISLGNTFNYITSGVSNHKFAIRTDGALFAWGNNAFGQLGDGTTINRSAPVKIGSSSWVQVEVGISHTIALDVNGRIYAWGGNQNGELGQSDVVSRSAPLQIGTSSWSAIGSSEGNEPISYAIRYGDGALFSWGSGDAVGLLGDGSGASTARSSPVQVGSSSFTQVRGNSVATAAIDINGFLHVWGSNPSHYLGIVASGGGVVTTATKLVNELTPQKIANTSNWIHVSAGRSHSLAINSNYDLYGWGNYAGTLPIQTYKYESITGLSSFYGSAITSSNTLHRWSTGALGLSGERIRSTLLFTGYEYNSDNWKYIIDWTARAFAGIKHDGTLWGSSTINTDGFIGDNTTTSRSNIVQVGADTNWSKLAPNILGIGTTISQHAIKTDGSLWGWGSGANGAIGVNSTISYSSPVQVSTGNSFTVIGHGNRHTIALRSDGTIWTWGLNSNGELGHNDRVDRSQPTQVGSASNWTWVGASGAPNSTQSFAIDSSGNAYAWGSILSGFVPRSSPSQVGSGRSWIMFSGTQLGFAGIAANGAIYVWGRGSEGQRGDGTIANAFDTLVPGTGAGGRSYVQVFGNYRAIFAIDSEKNLWTWGFLNQGGRWTIVPGNDLVVGHSSPVQIGIRNITNLSPTLISNNWKRVFAGTDYNVGIKTDNKLYVWGIQYEVNHGNLGGAVSLSANSTNLIASDAAIGPNRSVIVVLSTANTA